MEADVEYKAYNFEVFECLCSKLLKGNEERGEWDTTKD